MRRLPDTILFSSTAPDGISILSPWLAMMITVPWRTAQHDDIINRQTDDSLLQQTNLEDDAFAEGHISRYGKVVQLHDVWNAGKSLQKVLDLDNNQSTWFYLIES